MRVATIVGMHVNHNTSTRVPVNNNMKYDASLLYVILYALIKSEHSMRLMLDKDKPKLGVALPYSLEVFYMFLDI